VSRITDGGHRPAGLSRRSLCENFLYRFKAAPGAARAADAARTPQLPLTLPLRRRLVPVGWREQQGESGGAPENPGSRQGRGGFDKGTLAAALIGLMRAGQKPARSAGKRTGRRPLSNPPLRSRDADVPPLLLFDT
jgi:hypothetical protein